MFNARNAASIFAALLIIGVALAAGSTIVTPVVKTTTLSGLCTGTEALADISTTETFSGSCSEVTTVTSLSTTTSTSTTTTTSSSSTTTSSTTSTTSTTFTSGSNIYYVGAKVAQTPNTGVYSIINVVPQSFGGCLSFWIGDNSFSSGFWGQVGYFICDGDTPVGFYQVWNLNSYTIVAGGTTASLSIGEHNFSMSVSSGTTWTFAVDGQSMGSVDMKSNTPGSYEPIFAMSEQESVASPNAFNTVTFSSAINLKEDGVWVSATHASAYIYGAANPWSIAGKTQISTLPTDELQVGFGFTTTSNGNNLW